MFAVMLIFAIVMSLVINFAERMIREYNEEKATEPDIDEVVVAEKTKDFPENK